MAGPDGRIREALERWSLRPVVEALIALRGVDVVTAGNFERLETIRVPGPAPRDPEHRDIEIAG